MLTLLKYLKPYIRFAILAPLCMILEVGMDLLQPWLMADIIDKGIAAHDLHFVFRTCLLMLVTSFIAVLGGMGCSFYSHLTGLHFAADLRKDLFSHVLGLSFAETDKLTAPSLITRLTMDISNVQRIIVVCLRMMVRNPVTCIGGCIMALTIDARLGIILLIMIPIIIGVAVTGYKVGRPLFTEIQSRMDSLNKVIQENLSGIRVIRGFCRRDAEKERYHKASKALSEQHILVAKRMSAIFPTGMFFMNMGVLLVLYIGGWCVRNGDMTVGEVMAMVNYITRILFSFMFMAFMLNDIARSKASAERIVEVLDTKSSVSDDGKEELSASNGMELTFDNVSFSYPSASGSPILDGLSFSIPAGSSLAVLGATGSGKSTLAHLIPRFYDCSGGCVRINGKDIRDYSLRSLRDSMAIVLQDAVLFSGSISDNIAWGKEDAAKEQIVEAATTAQADSFASRFNDGYDTIVGQRGITLSGGQKQRVAIARALLRKPKLLILDDCSSALDLATEKALHDAMHDVLKDTTVLSIVQRVSSARMADRIMVLSNGRCAAIGTHDELLASCEIYREILSSQTGEDLPALKAGGQNG